MLGAVVLVFVLLRGEGEGVWGVLVLYMENILGKVDDIFFIILEFCLEVLGLLAFVNE